MSSSATQHRRYGAVCVSVRDTQQERLVSHQPGSCLILPRTRIHTRLFLNDDVALAVILLSLAQMI